jgi:hypothetical protein
MENSRLIPIKTFDSEVPAQFARITLDKLGIRSVVRNNGRLEDVLGLADDVELMVEHEDAKLANRILEQEERWQNEELVKKTLLRPIVCCNRG